MARIPMSPDVAELIGEAAEKVENRSLLMEKFCFHKLWPVVEEESHRGRQRVKWDEATRWSFVRIADGAAVLLRRDAQEKRRKAEGENVESHNRARLLGEAKIAETLASVSWDKPELASLRAQHTRRLIGLIQHGHRDRSRIVLARLEGRLAINLADSLVKNAGMALDRLFGLPYIPGSAVKGVARAAAYEELCAASGDGQARAFILFRSAFGTAESDFRPKGELASFRHLLGDAPADLRGGIAFLPAYPVDGAKVVVDLTNVHYPTYYQGDDKRGIAPGDVATLKEEKPQPNPFPCIEAGARFAFCLALTGRDRASELLVAADRWLRQALTVRGLGAKTAAGFGWFSIESGQALAELLAEEDHAREAERKAAEVAAAEKLAVAREIARKAALKPEDRLKEEILRLPDQAFAAKVLEVASLAAEEQRAVLLALMDPVKRDRWKKWKKSDKDTDGKRVAAVLAAAKFHNISIP